MDAHLRYDPGWFALSIAIAMGAAIAALWLASRDQTIGRQIAAAGVMGLAISGMHYTGMQAAVFTHEAHVFPAQAGADVNQDELAAAIAAITLAILLLASGRRGWSGGSSPFRCARPARRWASRSPT